MKKIVLILGIIIISALAIINLPKSPPKEIMTEDPQVMMDKNSSTSEIKKMDLTQLESSRYIDYTEASFDQMSDKKRVYFFHAKWCPTCKTANEEFMQNSNKIPLDVILFKTDYDTEKELKTKYGITYQHTFVYVDSNGNEVKKWNGGGIAELINNTTE